MKSLLLIHPPVAKPCEPPAGMAKLSGALSEHHIDHHVVDLNLECLLALLSTKNEMTDTWTTRAKRNLAGHLNAFKTWRGYSSIDRYRRAVADLHRLFQTQGSPEISRLTFSDFQHSCLSPLKSSDLLASAENYEKNIFYPYFSDRLKKIMEKTETRVIGISLNYLSQALCAFAIVGFIKKTFPDIKIVLGGGLVTSWIKGGMWKNQFHGIVDDAVACAGEEHLLSMFGIGAHENQQYSPSYELFPAHQYLAPGPILPYSSSVGCYWGECSFCPEKAEGNAYSQIPRKHVIQELRKLVSGKSPVLIHLVDNAVSPTVMEGLCANPPGAPWYGFARLTNHLANMDFCLALKRSGCVMLKLGLESGSQAVLDAMQKGNTLGCSSGVLKSLKKAGIATYVYLLFGTPRESELEANESLEFIANHSPYIDFLNIAVFNLPINSQDTCTLRTTGFYEGDLSLYTNFIHPQGWDRKHVKQFLDKKFRRHPAIQTILRHQPPGFGSNHAPLFAMQKEGGHLLKAR